MSGTDPGPVLATRQVVRRFGGLQALRGVDLEVGRGELVGLIGPNGAGKTTLFNVISGFLPPTSGKVYLEGQEVQGRPAYQLARRGLARTFQISRPFRNLSALENVLLGLGYRRFGHLWALLGRYGDLATRQAAQHLLERVGLGAFAAQPAGSLPLGLQRRLEVARALALEPRVLLLDEPVAGLNPDEAHELAELLRQLHRSGLTMLVVEHNMAVAMGLCQRIVVLHQGTKIAEGPPDVVASHPAVVEAYLGRAGVRREGGRR